jgi:hypothetical protein
MTGAFTVLELYIPDLIRSSIPNPSILTQSQKEHLLISLDQIAGRRIQSIFEELGFSLCNEDKCYHPEHPYEMVNPTDVSLDRVMSDRRALDEVVFEALGLTKEEQLEVYRAVIELVKNRLVKARSV